MIGYWLPMDMDSNADATTDESRRRWALCYVGWDGRLRWSGIIAAYGPMPSVEVGA